MSQDKFWEQWGAGSGQSGSPTDKSQGSDGSEKSGPVDDDVLAAWLKSLPPDDPLVPHPTALPSTSGNTADLAALWPPAAPVDPFSGISAGAGAAGGGEWDLAIDGAPAAPPTPTPAPPPPVAAAPAPPAPPFTPAPPSTSDFDLDLGGLSGPTPVGNPFATADPPVAAAPVASPPSPFGTPPPSAPPVPAAAASPAAGAPSPVSPFGPPIPPVAPPAENLAAPPLKVEISIGRRTFNQDIRGEALIGRPDATRGIHPEIDLRQDDAVSRRHAKIFMRDGRYVLTDLNSTNGTRHNRQWVQAEIEIPLNPGDEIEVGELTLIRVLEIPSTNA